MILNQREKNEILELLASKKVNLKFINEKEGHIYFKHPEFDSVQASIQRENEIFEIEYFKSSLNKTISVNAKDFASLKYRLSSWFDLVKKDYPKIIQEKKEIQRLSRRYYKVLEESIIIRNLGFEDSSGMIFRKALEILIKDYFIFLLPSFEEEILTKTVGGLISYFYNINLGEFEVRQKPIFESINSQLLEIKSLCRKIKKTFDIGNDFAHYERRLENFTTEELHLNILKIEQFIDFHLQEEFIKDMKGFLNAEFDADESIK